MLPQAVWIMLPQTDMLLPPSGKVTAGPDPIRKCREITLPQAA